jgi:hypothetical protein
MIGKRRHGRGQQVLSKSMYPGGLGNVAFELSLCVDVKDEAAARRQMPANPGKHTLPVGKASDVIYGVEYAANHVKPAVYVKIHHILLEKSGSRHFVARDRQHSA